MGKFDHFTLKQLRDELRKRKARVSGRKKDLLARLEAYDRNANFGADTPNNDPVWMMDRPDDSAYRDIGSSSNIPPITQDRIKSYLPPQDDISFSATGMYSNNFLRFVRSANSSSTFIRGQCRAEMKKQLSYFVDIQIEKSGVITHAQCECAAGLGPTAHCKHVQVVLLALVDFSTGKSMQLELTCTSKLQTFHAPKRLYTGSPVKSESLGILTHMHNVLYDPEPEQFKEDVTVFNMRVHNEVIGHAARSFHRMPLLQTIPPANMYAFCNDHNYLEKSVEELFLDSIGVTNITNEQAEHLEMTTRGQTKTKKSHKVWAYARTKRMHSSNFGRIVKATDRTDKMKLAKSLQLRNEILAAPLLHGRKFESVAIDLYEKKYGTRVSPSGIVVDQQYPYLACSPDGIIDNDTLIEVKCPYSARDRPINPISVPYLVNTPNGLQLKKTHDYMYQIQGQLAICEKKVCILLIYTFVEMKTIEIQRDEQFITNMRKGLEQFFTSFFKPQLLEQHLYKEMCKYSWN